MAVFVLLLNFVILSLLLADCLFRQFPRKKHNKPLPPDAAYYAELGEAFAIVMAAVKKLDLAYCQGAPKIDTVYVSLAALDTFKDAWDKLRNIPRDVYKYGRINAHVPAPAPDKEDDSYF